MPYDCWNSKFTTLDPHTWKLLQMRLGRGTDEVMRDIYDGAAYKKHTVHFSTIQHMYRLSWTLTELQYIVHLQCQSGQCGW